MKMRKIFEILCMILFMIGFLILCIPVIHECYVSYKMEHTIQSYLQWATPSDNPTTPTIPEEITPAETASLPAEYADLWNDMQSYNQKIYAEKQSGLFDTWTYEKPSFNLPDYGFPDETFGILTIPKMKLRMPLYLGATWQHMADGAAQLSQTSVPIGGENTNCVIAGHRGWRGAAYFREILKMELGDKIYIQNPWQTLEYQVTEIKIIDPDDVDAIHIQDGRDLVTLLTCHPYASGGKQRYLVICERR